jgi:hypothetical protein
MSEGRAVPQTDSDVRPNRAEAARQAPCRIGVAGGPAAFDRTIHEAMGQD